MKSLLSLSFIFTVLLTATSCQSQGSRSLKSHEDIRNEISFKHNSKLEMDVSRIVKTASRTKSVQFFAPKIN